MQAPAVFGGENTLGMRLGTGCATDIRNSTAHEVLPWGNSLDAPFPAQGATGDAPPDLQGLLPGAMSLEGLEDMIWGPDGRVDGGAMLNLLSNSPREQPFSMPSLPHDPPRSGSGSPRAPSRTLSRAGAGAACNLQLDEDAALPVLAAFRNGAHLPVQSVAR